MRFVPAFAALLLGVAIGFAAGIVAHDRAVEMYQAVGEEFDPPAVADPVVPRDAPLPKIQPAAAVE